MRSRFLMVVLVLIAVTIAEQSIVYAQANGKIGPFLTTLVEQYEQGGEEAAQEAAESRGLKLCRAMPCARRS